MLATVAMEAIKSSAPRRWTGFYGRVGFWSTAFFGLISIMFKSGGNQGFLSRIFPLCTRVILTLMRGNRRSLLESR